MMAVAGIVGRGSIGAAVAGRSSRTADGSPFILAYDASGLPAIEGAGVLVFEGDDREVLGAVESLRSRVAPGTVLVSAAPGLSLARIRDAVGPGMAVFRIVAVPAGLPEGGTLILCAEEGHDPAAFQGLCGALSDLGVALLVPEDALGASAALARSALGLLTVALEGIEEGAVSAGLPLDLARAFAKQTLLTTALLLQHAGGSPADLKDQVASPAGTTIAGLAVLEERGVRGAFMRAMEHAARPDTADRPGAAPRV